MNRKILFVCDSMRVGGIQNALSGLVSCLGKAGYDIDIYLFNDSENNGDQFEESASVLPSIERLRVCGMTYAEACQIGVHAKFKRALYSFSCRLFGSENVCKVIFSNVLLQNEYDVAISFTNDLSPNSPYYGSNQFVLDCVNAAKKIAWIHVDPLHFNINNDINRRHYARFDGIACVSEYVKSQFVRCFPDAKKKCYVVYNYIDANKLKRMSQLTEPEVHSEKFKIITIGRLEEKKNQICIPGILRKLKDYGISVDWILLGEGAERKRLEDLSQKLGVADSLIMIGEKDNPFPELVNSNLLVSVSKTESFGLAVAEALCLHIPVIALSYPALKEIHAHSSGLVMTDEDNLANCIIAFMNGVSGEAASLKIGPELIRGQFEALINGE